MEGKRAPEICEPNRAKQHIAVETNYCNLEINDFTVLITIIDENDTKDKKI